MSTLTPANAASPESDVTLTIVNPASLFDPVPNGFSHAIVTEGVGRVAYIAGQGGEDQSGALSPQFADQVQQAFANLHAALKAVGARPNQVARLTTYVVGYNQSMLDVMTLQIKEMFGASLPTQSLVPVPRLALDGMLFEVDAIAVLD